MKKKNIIQEQIKWIKANKWFFIAIIIILVLSLIIKIHIAHSKPLWFEGSDARTYHETASKLSQGEGYLDNYFNPGMSIFLTLIYFFTGPNYIAGRYGLIIVSFIFSYFVFKLARISVNKEVAYIAFIWSLFDPFIIFYATTEFGEMVMFTLIVMAMYYIYKSLQDDSIKYPILIGITTGLATLFKSWLIGLILIYIIFIFFNKSKKEWKKSIKNIFITIMAFFLILSPWIIYNYVRTNEFVISSTNGPLMLFYGNNPYAHVAFISYYPPEMIKLINPYDENLSRAELNKRAKEYAINYIINNPKKFIKKCFIFFFKYWSHPNSEWHQRPIKNWGAMIIYLWIKWFLAIIGILFVLRKYWKRHLVFYLFMLGATFSYMITVYLARYKDVLLPIQIIFASVGIILLINIIVGLIKQPKKCDL